MSQPARTLLIVDDEPLFARAVADDLDGEGLHIFMAHTGAEARRRCRETLVDLVLLDQRLPDCLGAELCSPLLETNERMKILFITAHPSFETALAAVRNGAFDYLSKPVEPEELRLAVRRCLETLGLERSQTARLYHRRREAADAVVVGARGLAAIRPLIDLASQVNSPVLLTGETGSGKSLVAKAIHFSSSRRAGELVSVNCAALPEALIEAELFGYERGAFTGAANAREGLLEMADGGTLFLDEIGEMPPHLQTRLLHVLEDGTVRRLGGRGARTIDFRLLAATNADVGEALRTRRLREDLYYRLNVLLIHMPPLRERREDIPELAGFFLARIAGPAAEARLAAGEAESLAAYDWPGNLRELRNVLERAFLLQRGGELRPSLLLRSPVGCPVPGPAATTEPRILPLAEVERQHIQAALQWSGGNLARAARALEISLSTLKRKRLSW